MFAVYQKIISPESSPLLGPANSPDLKPTDPNTLSSLCDCCSERSKDINANAANTIVKSTESEYEFNHATHYKYNKTTPRLEWYEFYDTCN